MQHFSVHRASFSLCKFSSEAIPVWESVGRIALPISHLEKESSVPTHSLLREQTPEGFFKVPNTLPLAKNDSWKQLNQALYFSRHHFLSDSFKFLETGNFIMKIITHSLKDTKILQNSFPNGRDSRPWPKMYIYVLGPF